MVPLRLAATLAAAGLFTSGIALWQARAMSAQLFDVTTFLAIGILVMLNVMLRFPGLGTLIAQYNQF